MEEKSTGRRGDICLLWMLTVSDSPVSMFQLRLLCISTWTKILEPQNVQCCKSIFFNVLANNMETVMKKKKRFCWWFVLISVLSCSSFGCESEDFSEPLGIFLLALGTRWKSWRCKIYTYSTSFPQEKTSIHLTWKLTVFSPFFPHWYFSWCETESSSVYHPDVFQSQHELKCFIPFIYDSDVSTITICYLFLNDTSNLYTFIHFYPWNKLLLLNTYVTASKKLFFIFFSLSSVLKTFCYK